MSEPSHVVYEIENVDLDSALMELRSLVSSQASSGDKGITAKCKKQREARISETDHALSKTVCYLVPSSKRC